MVGRMVDIFPPLAPAPLRARWVIGNSAMRNPARLAAMASSASTNADDDVNEIDFNIDVFMSRHELIS